VSRLDQTREAEPNFYSYGWIRIQIRSTGRRRSQTFYVFYLDWDLYSGKMKHERQKIKFVEAKDETKKSFHL
jgi:hypothetical protein